MSQYSQYRYHPKIDEGEQRRGFFVSYFTVWKLERNRNTTSPGPEQMAEIKSRRGKKEKRKKKTDVRLKSTRDIFFFFIRSLRNFSFFSHSFILSFSHSLFLFLLYYFSLSKIKNRNENAISSGVYVTRPFLSFSKFL